MSKTFFTFTPMIKLKDSAVQLIKDNKPLQVKIQAALGVTEKTMYNYVNRNSADLTKLSAIEVLVAETGLPLSELTTNGRFDKLMAK